MTKTLPTLYSISLTGRILQWSVDVVDNDIVIQTGEYLGGSRTIYKPILKAPKGKTIDEYAWSQATRKYLDKINKDGYKAYIAAAEGLPLSTFISKLSINKTDANNRLKPMKAFKGFPKKFPYANVIAQPKVNGLRATLRLETVTEGDGMFEESHTGPVFRSMSGLEYIMPHITDNLDISMFGTEKDMVFDGEFYGIDMTLNEIRASVRTKLANGTISTVSGNPHSIGFVMFDLSMPDIIQSARIDKLNKIREEYKINLFEDTHTDIDPINVLYTLTLYSKESIMVMTQSWISLGFEGSIIRHPFGEYGFGSRSSKLMAKIKVFEDTECEVLDIILKNEDSTRTYISFILKNDINDSTFEATPMGDEGVRQAYLNDKDYYIGKLATVKFYERSGVKEVPFHGNVVSIRPEFDL